MEVDALVSLKPVVDFGVLMSSVVIHDDVQIQIGGRLLIHTLQELQEFLMAMARHTVGDNGSLENIESGKQRRCTVAFVVVGLASRDSGRIGS